MNRFTKNFFAISLTAALAFAAGACTKESPVEEELMTLQEYVDTFGNDLIESFEESFSNGSGGVECKTEVSASGNDLIINCSLVGINDMTAEMHKNLKTAIAGLEEPLKLEFVKISGDVESLANVKFNLCEEDGDVIAELNLGMDNK